MQLCSDDEEVEFHYFSFYHICFYTAPAVSCHCPAHSTCPMRKLLFNADQAKKEICFSHTAAHNRHSGERVKQTCHPSDKDCDSLVLEEGRQCPNGPKMKGLQLKWKHRAENWLFLTAGWFIGTTLRRRFALHWHLHPLQKLLGQLLSGSSLKKKNAEQDFAAAEFERLWITLWNHPLHNVTSLKFKHVCMCVRMCVCGLGGVDGPNMRWPAQEWGNDLKKCSSCWFFFLFNSLELIRGQNVLSLASRQTQINTTLTTQCFDMTA